MSPSAPFHRPAIVAAASLLAGVLAIGSVHAASVFAVNQAWVAPAPAARSTEAYMELLSSEPAVLARVCSDVSARVTLHPPGKQISKINELALKPKVPLQLAAGRYRVVLHDLTRPLALGDRVALTLTVRARDGSTQEIPVNAEVRLRSPLDDESNEHHHTQPSRAS